MRNSKSEYIKSNEKNTGFDYLLNVLLVCGAVLIICIIGTFVFENNLNAYKQQFYADVKADCNILCENKIISKENLEQSLKEQGYTNVNITYEDDEEKINIYVETERFSNVIDTNMLVTKRYAIINE